MVWLSCGSNNHNPFIYNNAMHPRDLEFETFSIHITANQFLQKMKQQVCESMLRHSVRMSLGVCPGPSPKF